nr:helix-turn-helix transcriptional regulator [uncultured Caproiciproducens sp.]
MTLIDRITKIAKDNHISGTKFGEILGLSKSPLTDWKNSKSKPTLEQIIKICEYFSISSDEILFGNKTNSCVSNEEDSLLQDFKKLDKREQQIVLGKISEMIYNKKMEESSEKLSSKVLWDLLADTSCKEAVASKHND